MPTGSVCTKSLLGADCTGIKFGSIPTGLFSTFRPLSFPPLLEEYFSFYRASSASAKRRRRRGAARNARKDGVGL